MKIESGNIDRIFSALDQQIRIMGGVPVSLVVCGGTALAALGLLNRTTKDVDVLAGTEETGSGLKILPMDEFPPGLSAAAQVVARDFNLPKDWLNLGPAPQVKTGLPEGLAERLVRKSYGKFLTMYFISRRDQIFFKLYAAVDRDDYHLQDLKALNPASEEIEASVRWVLTQDVSEEFRMMLKDFLIRNGYENIAPGV